MTQFKRDMDTISAWARAHPDNMARTLQFTVISARVPLYRVPGELLEAIEEPDRGNALFGWKRRAFAEIWNARETIHWHLEEIIYHAATEQDAADTMLLYLLSFHGLGFAKAGFAVQLCYGLSGCLDTWNLKRYGIPERTYRTDGRAWHDLSLPRKVARVRAYNDHVNRLGGTHCLWAEWCSFLANQYPKTYRDAHAVSALHAEALRPFGLT